MNKYDYIILGAGITGLSAGLKLKNINKNLNILILEKNNQPGGLARSITYKNYKLDLGPHRLYSPISEINNFWKNLLGNNLISVKRKSKMYLYGKYLEYPFKIGDLLKNLPLSKGILFISSYLIELLKNFVNKKHPSKFLRDFSYDGYLQNRFGKPIHKEIFAPYAKKVWGLQSSELSSWILKKRVSSKNILDVIYSILNPQKAKKLARQTFFYPKFGMNQLIDKMILTFQDSKRKIILNEKVLKLEKKSDGWIVKTEKNSFLATKIIYTLPLPHIQYLIPELNNIEENKLKNAFSSLTFRKIGFFYVFINKKCVSDNTWYYFPEENITFSRISELKNFSPYIFPENKTVLCCEVPQDQNYTFSENDKNNIISSLEKIDLVKKSEIDDIFFHEEKFCYPVYDLIFEAKLKIIFKKLSQYDNLICTGRQGLFHHNNIDHAIIMGFETAKYCEENFIVNPYNWYFDKIKKFEKFEIID